ncbi:phage structural protein [Streptococcus varani]|uniref:Phage structural protein n=1 Tax=Streptococcus varani TaxID=1608583 RepID=A0A0E4CRT8_9STRE|nr:DUF859 domain-containing protein [Streptococcus varani]CQR23758.1 phage structural protein [Streptococcus varani]CQR25957.1 phage structural protein [Streptococcus varani]
MAEFWSNNDRGYRIRLWIDQTSQNIAGNSSQVRVRLALLNTTTTFAEYNCTASATVNGQTLSWSGRPSMLSYNQTIMLIDKTITVGHNADGKKSFSLSASFSGSGGWSPGTLSIGGNSFTLTTIPRSSSVSVGTGVIGSAVTINISRQSSSFKHTVRYHWGSKQGTIASNVDTSTTWTIPLDFANDIPNSTSGTGIIYVDTYSGSTKTGTQSTTLTASVPTNMKPTFTGVSLSDFNTAAQNLVSSTTTFIQIVSNIKVTFNGGAGSYGSSITGYKAEIVGKNQTTNVNGGTLGIMNYNGAITIRASVSDSRGRWSDTRDVSVTVLEYFAPALSFSIARTGSTSSTFTVTRNARVAPLAIGGAQKNIMTLSFKVARLGTTTYTADTGTAAGSWTSLSSLINSQANLSGTYAANQSWVVIGTLADRFTQTEFAINVATESVVFSYDRSGVGVNKIRERGALDVNGDIYANGNPIQQHKLTENNGRIITVSNANLVTSAGFYYMVGARENSPGNQYGYLTVWYNSDNFISQMFMPYNSTDIYTRRMTNGAWGSWSQLAVQNTSSSFSRLNITDTATFNFTIMWGVGISAMRKGNLVTLTVDRAIKNINSTVEYGLMSETIPAGYRPIKEAHLIIQANSGPTISGTSVVHLAPDGQIRLTNNITGNKVWTGTITYVTNDPYP